MKYKLLVLKNIVLNDIDIQCRQKINSFGKIIGAGFFTFGKINRRKRQSYAVFYRMIKSCGICLNCGEIDWRVLDEHHPDKEMMPDFTFTLCANCHRKLHWFIGK